MPNRRVFSGAAAGAAVGGGIQHIGGGTDPAQQRAGIGWNQVHDPQADRGTILRALPAAREHAGVAVWQGRIHMVGGRFWCMGGEGRLYDAQDRPADRVIGSVGSHDPVTDAGQSHAPMPRHGLGAAVLAEWMQVAGGGPIVGGGLQTAVHAAFTPGGDGSFPARITRPRRAAVPRAAGSESGGAA